MIKHTKNLLWRTLAVLSIVMGVIGIALPVLPTVPFILLAAWAASKGWPELEAYLLNHPVYGPPIRQWREHGAVSSRAKVLACTMLSFSAIMLWFVPIPDMLRWGLYAFFVVTATWLCLRPAPPAETSQATSPTLPN